MEAEQDQLDTQDGLDILLAEDPGDGEDLLPSADDFDVVGDTEGLEQVEQEEFAQALGEAGVVDSFAFDDEVGELPDGLSEDKLLVAEEVDLSGCGELSLPQVRRVAQVLARNESLTSIKLEGHTLPVGDLQDEDELEWDSEEYTDTDAILISQLLRANTTVKRLDLARNQIGDAGACALAELLIGNATIEYLNLESNMFGEKAGRAFRAALSLNSTLQYLNLMYNSVPNAVNDEIRDTWGASRESQGVGLHL